MTDTLDWAIWTAVAAVTTVFTGIGLPAALLWFYRRRLRAEYRRLE